MMTILAMEVAEFKHVESEIDTWYHDKYINEPIIEHAMPDFVYYATNHGFHKYLFFDKIPNVQIEEYKQWDT